jgi:hypothetical protein
MLSFWWSKSPAPGNFGDVLTPYILDHFGIRYRYNDRPRSADALCIGSIAKFAQKNTIVLGSGTMRASDELCARADWRFVRGPHTRDVIRSCGGDCPEIYGDPALLLPLIQPPAERRDRDVGIVPHYVDYDYVVRRYPNENVIRLVDKDPLRVAYEISRCKRIVSSSLHGIIAAHAYGIPAAWVEYSGKLAGDGIKFADHFASVGVDEPIKSWPSNPCFVSPRRIDTESIIDRLLELK